MTGTHIKFYLVETEYNKTNSLVDVLKNELENNKTFAKDLLASCREALVNSADDETFKEIIAELYPMLFSVSTKLSVAADVMYVQSLDDFDTFCEKFLDKVDIVSVAETMSCVFADEIFGEDKNEIKCLNFNDVEKIVQDIQRAVESPLESLKSGNKWMCVNPCEFMSVSRFLTPVYDAMKRRKDEGTESYLLCMPQH